MRFIPIVDRPFPELLYHAPRPTGNDVDVRDTLDKEEVVGGMSPNSTVWCAFSQWRMEFIEIFAVGCAIPPLMNETGASCFCHRVKEAERWRWWFRNDKPGWPPLSLSSANDRLISATYCHWMEDLDSSLHYIAELFRVFVKESF